MKIGPISAVRVFVTELAPARAFYRDQLGLTETLADDSVLVFDTGSADLVVELADPADAEEHALIGRFVGVSFTVPDIHAAHKALRDKGVRFDAEPEQQPWGAWLAHILDPAGNVLTLVQLPDGVS